MKKLLAILLALCLFAGYAFANGGSDSAANEDGIIEISMMDIWVETEAFYIPINDAIARFEADNPNVKINREIMPSQAYLVQVPTLGAANELPDIVASNGSMTRQFASTGAIISLQDYIDSDSNWKNRVYPTAWLEHMYDGDAYGQPLGAGNYGYIVYNQAIFDEVGIDGFPADLDEFHAACEKLLAAGYIPLALGDAQLWPADSINFSSFVNNFVGVDWTTSIFTKDGTAAFTDPEFVAALEAFGELGTKGYFNENCVSITHAESLGLYMSGKAAMRGWGDWEEPVLVDSAPEIAAVSRVAAYPGPARGAKATNSYESSSAWAFNIGSGLADEAVPYAVDFLSNYVCSDEWARYNVEVKFQFSPWTMPDFDESKLPQITLDRIAFKERSDSTACMNYDAVLDAAVKDVYQRGLQSLLIGAMTAEQLAKDMQTEYEMSF